MALSFFEQLKQMSDSGKRFTSEEIISIKESAEYQKCGFTERAFIDVLFKHRSTSHYDVLPLRQTNIPPQQPFA